MKKYTIELTVADRRKMYTDALGEVCRINKNGGHAFVCNILNGFLLDKQRTIDEYVAGYSLPKLFPELFMFKRKNINDVWLAVSLHSTAKDDNKLRMTVLSLCIEMCKK